MRNFLTKTLPILPVFVPVIAFAAPQNFPDLVSFIISIINMAIGIVVALAVLGFFWGLSKFILSNQDGSKIEEGRKIMVWGIIALFVMVSVWGILNLLANTFF